MRTWWSAAGTALLLAALVSSCGTNKPQGAGTGGAGASFGGGGAGGTGARKACLDSPGGLARPPSNGLPCELIPPGLTL